MPRLLSGREAIGIMVWEIGEAIGRQRLREFETKVRAKIQPDASANDWITAMADVIVEDDDTRADQGFRRGLSRIREQAAGLEVDPALLRRYSRN